MDSLCVSDRLEQGGRVACSLPRCSRQDLCEKCGRFPPREAKAVARRGFHNDRADAIAVIPSKLAEFKAKPENRLKIANCLASLLNVYTF
jgi:hypothetical protein